MPDGLLNKGKMYVQKRNSDCSQQEYPVFSPLDRDLYVMGIVCGLIGTIFGYGVIYAQRLFKTLQLYAVSHARGRCSDRPSSPDVPRDRKPRDEPDPESISSNEKIHMTTLPCIFVSTILSQAVGASAGKRGSCLTDRRMHRKLFRRCVPYG